MDDTSDIKVEKVGVEDGLHDSGNNSNGVEEAFGVVSVDPVENVEESVRSESEEVVSSDGFGISRAREHEELGHDGDGFQIDGEGPHHLHEHELVVDDECENQARDHQKFDAESVVVTIVCCLEFHPHEVDGSNGSSKKENFHDSIV